MTFLTLLLPLIALANACPTFRYYDYDCSTPTGLWHSPQSLSSNGASVQFEPNISLKENRIPLGRRFPYSDLHNLDRHYGEALERTAPNVRLDLQVDCKGDRIEIRSFLPEGEKKLELMVSDAGLSFKGTMLAVSRSFDPRKLANPEATAPEEKVKAVSYSAGGTELDELCTRAPDVAVEEDIPGQVNDEAAAAAAAIEARKKLREVEARLCAGKGLVPTPFQNKSVILPRRTGNNAGQLFYRVFCRGGG